MGRSNITQNLERDLSFFLGERQEKVVRLQRIEQLVESLPELRERIAKLDSLINAGEFLLKERIPDWTPERVRPIQKFQCRSPIEYGSGVRKGLEVLRDAAQPLTSREITNEVLTREAIFDLDSAGWEAIRTNIDAGLRKHQKDGRVESDGRKPARWWLASTLPPQVTDEVLSSHDTDLPQCYLE